MVASGNEVGKISIRVVPNLEDFHDDLERKLKAEEKKQRDKAAAKAKVRADTEEYEEDLGDANKRASKDSKVAPGFDPSRYTKEYEKATKDLPLPEPDETDVPLKIDLDRFKRRQLSQFQKMMAEFEVNIPLTVDGEILRKQYKDLETGFLEKLRLLDPKKDQEALTQLRREIDTFYKDVREQGTKDSLLVRPEANLKVERLGDLEKSQRNLELLMDQLNADLYKAYFASEKVDVLIRASVDQKWLVRQLVSLKRTVLAGTPKLVVDVDKGRFQKALLGLTNVAIVAGAAISKTFGAVASGVGKFASAGVSAVKSFARLPEWVLITVAAFALLPPVLSIVSGLLVALPGVIAGVAIPMGVIALGIDGIKKAAETAKPAFEDLKKSISDTFSNPETGMVKGFEEIRDRLIPGLKAPLQGVAESLSGAFNGVMSTLSSPTGLNNLQVTIDNISAAIQTATPGLQSFTSGLTKLVAELSKGFPGFGEALSNLGAEFSAWVDKVSANGQLQSAMSNLAGVLSEIGGLIKDIAGWSFAKLADDSFMNSVKGFVEDLRTIVDFLLPGMEAAWRTIAGIIAPIGDAIRLIGQGKDWVQDKLGIGGADDAVKDAEKAGGDARGAYENGWVGGGGKLEGDVFTDFVDTAKQQLETGLGSTAGVPFDAAGIADGIRNQLSGQIQAAITEAQASIQELGPTLQASIDGAVAPLESLPTKISGVFDTLVPAITGSFDTIKTTVTAGITEMTTGIGDAFNLLPQSASTAFQGIQDTITGAFGFMVLAIGQQAENINTAVGQAFNQIPETIGTALSGMVQAVPDALSGVPEAVRSALSGVPGAVAGAMLPAIDVVSQVMLGIVNVVTAVGAQVAAVAAATFAQFPPAVQGAMAPAVTAVGTIGQQMVAAALSFGGAMESAGRSIGASFAAGIASSSGLVSAAASSLMAAARAFIPSSPAEKGPFSGRGWVTYSGESVGEGFAKGMQNSTGDVVSTARELMQAVKDIFGSAEGLTLNFNLGGVTEQAEAATKQVQVFGDTLSQVPTGPLKDLAVASGTGSSAGSEAKRDELSQQLDLLEMERKSLELEKGRAGANQDAIKARLAEIKEQKLQLGLQKDQLDYAKKYGAETEQTGGKIDQFYRDMGEKIFKMPTDFARAIGAQFTQDLGISGQGAIPQLLEQGSQFIFQVANMDTALSAQQTLQRRQGMGLVGR